MGAFLDKPVVDKTSGSAQLPDGTLYAHSTMQGWRTSQEDAHACAPGFDGAHPDRHLFAVFDGHGGAEVAQYLARHLPQYLLDTSSYQEGDFEQALKDAFLGLDAKLLEPAVADTLKSYAKASRNADSDSESDADAMVDEATALRKEAKMPLDRLLRSFGAAAAAARRRRHAEGDEGGSDEDKPEEEGSESEAAAPETAVAVAENENNENTEREAAAADPVDANGSGDCEEATASTSKAPGSGQKKKTVDVSVAEEAEEDEDKDYVPGDVVEGKVTKVGDAEEEEAEEEDDGEDEEEEDDEDDEDESEESEEEESEEDYEVIMPAGDDPGVDSGTTAVVALLVGRQLFVANAGDSRAVLSDAGVALDMSLDHKPEDEPERSRIEAAGGHVTKEGRVNGGLNLSRALGDHAYKQNAELSAAKQIISPLPDVRVVTLTDSHRFLLLACDGIWNSLTSQQAVDFCEKRLATGLSPERVCEALFDHCLAPDAKESDGTGCDNMTSVLVCFPAAAAGSVEVATRKRPMPAEVAAREVGVEANNGCGESDSKRAKEG